MDNPLDTALTRIVLFALVLSSAGMSQPIDVRKGHNELVMRNDRVQRTISFTEGGAGSIGSGNTLLGKKMISVVTPQDDTPWFSVRIDDIAVTNLMKCWTYESYKTRILPQGGTETTLRFHASHELIRSLVLEIVIQLFSRSSVCREKLRFTTSGTDTAFLSLKEGRIACTFPGAAYTRSAQTQNDAYAIQLASWGTELIETQNASSFIDRTLEEGRRIGRNLTQNYMYHPRVNRIALHQNREELLPGPIVVIPHMLNDVGLVYAYEHGSPDNDPEQQYIGVHAALSKHVLRLQTSYEKGIYVGHQAITAAMPFETPWSMTGFFTGPAEQGTSLVWTYLNSQICESPVSREPYFYYNTWGMQRDEERKGNNVRKVLTKERVLQEADRAALLNVDIFVLDDGWQDAFGDWNPDTSMYRNGLRWLCDSLRQRRMMPGLWFAALAADSAAQITRRHPEWLIRNAHGEPVVGQWEKNFFCFDSDFREYFIRKCKERIDEGFRFFKWDGINKVVCTSPDHHHGTAANTPEERREKQGFDLPLLVADAIRQLREYEPTVIVEIDVTEPDRSVGLAILSEGKYFWMNNGASTYGDYTTFRSMSTRFIPGLFATVFPPSLQTYANYPHNVPPYSAWRSAVNSSLIGGRGFWGNLAPLDPRDLRRAGALVEKSKRVMHEIVTVPTTVTGSVGASPEMYECVNRERGAGQVIGFSGAAGTYHYPVAAMRKDRVLGVLNNSYHFSTDSLIVEFEFTAPDASREAFVLPGGNTGICVSSSTSWLDDLRFEQGPGVRFVNGAPGIHTVEWDARNGEPSVTADHEIVSHVVEQKNRGIYLITITTTTPLSTVHIRNKK